MKPNVHRVSPKLPKGFADRFIQAFLISFLCLNHIAGIVEWKISCLIPELMCPYHYVPEAHSIDPTQLSLLPPRVPISDFIVRLAVGYDRLFNVERGYQVFPRLVIEVEYGLAFFIILLPSFFS